MCYSAPFTSVLTGLLQRRLISASVGTVVYYGFQGHDDIRNVFLSLCLLMGMAGSVLPFMKWFNNRKYRVCLPPSPEERLPLTTRPSGTASPSSSRWPSSPSRRSAPSPTSTPRGGCSPSLVGPSYTPLTHLQVLIHVAPFSAGAPEPVLLRRRARLLRDALSRVRTLGPARACWLDWLGGGSHAIWHAFIVLAISQHKWAMAELKRGVA